MAVEGNVRRKSQADVNYILLYIILDIQSGKKPIQQVFFFFKNTLWITLVMQTFVLRY